MMNAIESLTSLLSIPSIVFLAMEILILLIGVLLGLKRGLGRTAVRATYLVIIAVLSLLIARGSHVRANRIGYRSARGH